MDMKPILFNTEMVQAILEGRKTQTRRIIKPVAMGLTHENGMPARVPPYEPGDILWVRETWNNTVYGGKFCYKADFSYKEAFPWKPSIHMPKEAARIFLKVVNVRPHRLLEISRQDAVKEGANPAAAVENFKAIWNGTLKKEAIPMYGWDANPWVWVIEFERIRRDEVDRH